MTAQSGTDVAILSHGTDLPSDEVSFKLGSDSDNGSVSNWSSFICLMESFSSVFSSKNLFKVKARDFKMLLNFELIILE